MVRPPEGGNGFGTPRVMSTPGSSNKTGIWRDLVLLIVLGALVFVVVTALAGGRPAAIATGAFSILALMVLAARHDARETATESASRDEQPPRAEDELQGPPQAAVEEPAESTSFREQPQALSHGRNGQDGWDREEDRADQQGVVATQTISPALYGTGVIDEVTGQIGQVNLLETGLNVLAKVNDSGTINEANEGMDAFLAGRKPNFDQFRQRDKRELARYLDGCEKDLNAPPSMRKEGSRFFGWGQEAG